MPKNRKVIKNGNAIKKLNDPRKLLVGSRKTGVAATLMTTEALKAARVNNDLSKSRNIIESVLRRRGITDWSIPETV